MSKIKKPTVISTFAGGGGSSLGYKMAGFEELLAVEWDDNAVKTLRLNFPEIPIYHGDIKNLSVKKALEISGIKKGELDVLDGSPPCQGFSTAGKREVCDDRNDLFKEYVRLIKGLQPKVFVMENVSGMVKGKMKGKFLEILKTLKSTGYNVKCKLLNAMWYEVPQSRERLIFIGVREDFKIDPVYPEKIKKIITFKDIDNGDRVIAKYSDKRYGDILVKNNKPFPTITKLSRYFVNRGEVVGPTTLKLASSFPGNYNFTGTYSSIKDRIGNAVPPKMMYHIAKTIKKEILDKSNNVKQT